MSDKLGKMITNVIEVEKNGVKVVIKQQYNKEINDINIDFTKHDKVFEDKIVEQKNEISMLKSLIDNYRDAESKLFDENQELKQITKGYEDKIVELKKDYKTASELLGKYQQENETLKKKIIELENFSCQAEQEAESLVEKLKQRIAELESKETETCEKDPVLDDCRPSMEWYENRHQSDCIEINRLNTTIDVLIHKVEYLRQFAGLE